ncbi:Ni2+-binding GTPase [Paenibacillus thiaminolyticus]|uniref:Ni2+-binding GTPase n=1 Tax=Paenibacillus thiaminolyticus TaxID=49283 RepID=UPI0023313B0D|nr:Ni2+-binding GTPase [Paenibacillus thiaminolyticus]WCF07397.1 Ni2+-binding GTPase [Paenibacillus thiaminolyticus]
MSKETSIQAFAERIKALEGGVNEETGQLLDEMLHRMEALTRENERLRKSALAAARSRSGMSTKLKDALYE